MVEEGKTDIDVCVLNPDFATYDEKVNNQFPSWQFIKETLL